LLFSVVLRFTPFWGLTKLSYNLLSRALFFHFTPALYFFTDYPFSPLVNFSVIAGFWFILSFLLLGLPESMKGPLFGYVSDFFFYVYPLSRYSISLRILVFTTPRTPGLLFCPLHGITAEASRNWVPFRAVFYFGGSVRDVFFYTFSSGFSSRKPRSISSSFSPVC